MIALFPYAATRPAEFTVERSIRIAAPPDRIYPLIDDFHRWSDWSPFERLDPDMQRTFGGASNGVGAQYEWHGNSSAGSGRMAITSTSPPHEVVLQLDFSAPFEAHNTVEFTLEPMGSGTEVTWVMRGRNGYFGKLIGIFYSMDRMVGGDFETGLAALKRLAEHNDAAAG